MGVNNMIHATVPGAGDGYNTDSPWNRLAVAIVQQAVEDYKKVLRAIWKNPKKASERQKLVMEKNELELFFRSGDYEMYCNIDPERLIKQCRISAIEDEKRAIQRTNAAKIRKMKKLQKEQEKQKETELAGGQECTENEEITGDSENTETSGNPVNPAAEPTEINSEGEET